MALSPKLEQTLRAIHEGTLANGTHHANPNHPMIAALVNSGHISTDTNRIDPNDGRRVAVSVTEAGHTELGIPPAIPAATPVAQPDTTPTQETPMNAVTEAVKTKRARTTVVPEVRLAGGFMAMPADQKRRGGNRTETYAFGKLEAPRPDGSAHSFFVPATTENPDPALTLRAAVSSANARYKDKEGAAQFKHFVVDHDAEFGVAGVRVFRVK